MSWDEKSIQVLKENYGKKSASQIAEMLPGKSRNSIIGKCYRLGLSNNSLPKKKMGSRNEVNLNESSQTQTKKSTRSK